MTSIEKLKALLKEMYIIQRCSTVVSWDFSTTTPKEGKELISEMMGYLSGVSFDKITSPELKETLEKCELEQESYSVNEKAMVRELRKTIDKLSKIPQDEYVAFSKLRIKSETLWEQAKEENNYGLFKDTLKEVIDTKKKFAEYMRKDEKTLYDVMLNDFEPGFDTVQLDEFFNLLREEIVPLIKKIQDKGIDFKNPVYKEIDVEAQKKFNLFLADYIGFNLNRGVIRESMHPFTTELSKWDVRFTTHYYPEMIESAMFSTIHEGGHGIYEQGVSDELAYTNITGGVSMAVHESQSRFYENNLGRNVHFWNPIFDKFKEAYDLDINQDDFMNYINKAEPSLIRTEADELTYPLHIMIRYELEKKIINGEYDINELNKLWNETYKEYLGVDVPTDSEGILQDVHWCEGLMGYFPSYAVGSAIAAQIYAYMDKQFSIEECLESGDLSKIKAFLNEHIHQYGMVYNTNELLEKMMGEKFNPKYFVDYLKEKYTRVYGLDD